MKLRLLIILINIPYHASEKVQVDIQGLANPSYPRMLQTSKVGQHIGGKPHIGAVYEEAAANESLALLNLRRCLTTDLNANATTA